jgi:transcription antitermination factor NusG
MMDASQIDKRWLAVQVHAGREFMAANGMKYRGYSEFVPTYEKRCRDLTSSVIKRLPLFTGYVFVQFDAENRHALVKVPYVIRLVGNGPHPTPIDDTEIKALMIATTSGRKCGPCSFANTGQQVEIENGALKGVRGTLVRWKNGNRLLISINLLRQSVLVELDSYDVAPMVISSRADA